MEWEYLQGFLGAPSAQSERFSVRVLQTEDDEIRYVDFDHLGHHGWEYIGSTDLADDVLLIFKRQKLYPVGAATMQPAF